MAIRALEGQFVELSGDEQALHSAVTKVAQGHPVQFRNTRIGWVVALALLVNLHGWICQARQEEEPSDEGLEQVPVSDEPEAELKERILGAVLHELVVGFHLLLLNVQVLLLELELLDELLLNIFLLNLLPPLADEHRVRRPQGSAHHLPNAGKQGEEAADEGEGHLKLCVCNRVQVMDIKLGLLDLVVFERLHLRSPLLLLLGIADVGEVAVDEVVGIFQLLLPCS
mmetsp:Transcript_3638/g.5475  ORF Transcript_3638/g.5475 Transcript_3638/m.5475 type:complete len:227 (+) Transcript_3638:2775-3455(+)